MRVSFGHPSKERGARASGAQADSRETKAVASTGIPSASFPDRRPPHMLPGKAGEAKRGHQVGGALGVVGWARGARGRGAVRSKAPSDAQAVMRMRLAPARGGLRGKQGKERAACEELQRHVALTFWV